MKTITYCGIDIYYQSNLNGGGMDFGQDYINVIKKRYNKKFDYTYEFCSGPGYIGFSLLAHDLTERLCLSDKFLPAYEAVKQTIVANNLHDKVDCYCLDGVKNLPSKGFDLVVSNPPHFLNECDWLKHIEDRIYIDKNWNVHREFYQNIGSRLRDDGVILIQENALGSNRSSFESMIQEASLMITDVFEIESPKGSDQIYYIEVKKK